MKEAPLPLDNDGPFKNARAGGSEQMFNHIRRNAVEQGLKINPDKTTILTVSGAVSYEARSHIYDHNKVRIDSTDTLKALDSFSTDMLM